MNLDKIESNVKSLVLDDAENRTNITWLVAIFVSLRNAQRNGFLDDTFVTRPHREQQEILLRIIDRLEDILHLNAPPLDE